MKVSVLKISDRIIDQCARWLSLFSFILVLTLILFPYDFFHNGMAGQFDHSFQFLTFEKQNYLSDFVTNVLLFLPLGFALTCFMRKKGQKTLAVKILIASSGLSLLLEVLQTFLPTRTASILDVIANTSGAVFGFWISHLWGNEILWHASVLLEKAKKLLSVKILTASFLGYTVAITLLSIFIQGSTNLSDWDDTMPLLVGNESTGDRPWRGHVYRLAFTNKAIPEEDVANAFSERETYEPIEGALLASYRFTDEEGYHDLTGHLPELIWKGGTPKDHVSEFSYMNGKLWLTTQGPAEFLTEKIRETNQFTLIATVATAATVQTGPARIISLSKDPYHRNFTLGQSGSDLVFRIRTPLTGENGINPELNAPNVFANTQPVHLVITYDGSVLMLYVNGVRHAKTLHLSPELSLFSQLFRIDACEIRGYKALYYGLVFSPLGFLLALIYRFLTI